MHPMMGKLAHPWGRPIRPSASGRLPHRSHCQCCSRCGSYHRPRCGSHHVRWLVLGFLCLERSWLLIETKMRRIDHKWWDDLIHRLYRNIRSLERNMNNFVGGHARQIIIYIYICFSTNSKPGLLPYSNLICVVQFYRNIQCLESISESNI